MTEQTAIRLEWVVTAYGKRTHLLDRRYDRPRTRCGARAFEMTDAPVGFMRATACANCDAAFDRGEGGQNR